MDYTPLDLMLAVKKMIVQDSGQSWPTWDGETLDRTSYVTASEASRCARDLAFDKMMQIVASEQGDKLWDDYTLTEAAEALPPDAPVGYFERGHNVEAWYVDRIREALSLDERELDELYFAGEEQVSFHVASERVSATPDGIHAHAFGNWLFEVKSAGANIYSMTRAKSAHAYQVNVSMGVINELIEIFGSAQMRAIMDIEDTAFEFSKITQASVHYINASNYMDCRTFMVQYDGGKAYHEAAHKAKLLFDSHGRLRDPLTVEPQGVSEGLGCGFCRFKRSCKAALLAEGHADLAARIDAKPAAAKLKKLPDLFSQGANEVGVARKYVQAKLRAEAEAAKVEAMKPEVQKIVEAAENERFPVTVDSDPESDVYVLALIRSEGRKSLQKDRLEALANEHGFEVDDLYKTGARSKSLRMNKKED